MSVFVSGHLVVAQLPEGRVHCVNTSSSKTLLSHVEHSVLQKTKYCRERERPRGDLTCPGVTARSGVEL